MAKQVKDQSSMHRYRTEIPNIIDDMDLSVYAFRLYVRLKRVAGDDGRCFYSTRELAEQCRMSVGAVSKAKQDLVDADLIRIERAGDWERDNITITDMWPANFAYFAMEKEAAPCSPHEQDCSHSEQAVHHMNTSVHQVNTIYIEKEEPLKEEPIKKGERAGPPPPPRLHRPLNLPPRRCGLSRRILIPATSPTATFRRGLASTPWKSITSDSASTRTPPA